MQMDRITNKGEFMKIYQQIIECMREIKAIEKDQLNKQQGFKFRGIDQVYNALNPVLAKHGVFTVPMVLTVKTEEKTTKSGTVMTHVFAEIEYKFYANDGSHVIAVVHGEALDSGDKALNKAMSIAHKYALLQVFAIPTAEEKDPDYQAHELAVDYKKAFRQAWIKFCDNGLDKAKLEILKNHFNLKSLDDWNAAYRSR